MHSESSVSTACPPLLFSKFSERWSLPNYAMHPVIGGVSPRLATKRLTAFIRRSIRQGTTDFAEITSFIDTADDILFRQILTNPNHVLAHLLPEKVNTHYQLRPRQHDRQLIPKTTKLYSCNFVIRMLCKHSY